MKISIFKILFTLTFAVSLCQAIGQRNYFKFDLGLVYPQPVGTFHPISIGIYAEPKFNITDNISAGVKLEADAASSGAASLTVDNSTYVSSQMAAINVSLTGDYYFGDAKNRPFAGLSVGKYWYARNFSGNGSDVQQAVIGAGFAPRIGVVLGTFRLAVEYNIVGKKGASASVSSGAYSNIRTHFVGFKLGWEIGGSKRYR